MAISKLLHLARHIWAVFLVLSAVLVAIGLVGTSDAQQSSSDVMPNSGPDSGGTEIVITIDDFEQHYGFSQTVNGTAHTCALRVDNTIWCWGDNTFGQLGDGTTTERHIPTQVSGIDNVSTVAAGYYHTCAIFDGGKVACWGANDSGQLGNGTSTDATTPIDVPGLATAQDITAGLDYTCAKSVTGQVWCWGANDSGQLGSSVVGIQPTPVPVSGLDNVSQIATGYMYSCATKLDKTVACWGSNDGGHSGSGNIDDYLTPMPIAGLSDVKSVSIGGNGACAVKNDGSVTCWTESTGPLIPIVNVGNVVDIATSFDHACALMSTGTVWCWGDNTFGQLGNNAVEYSDDPLLVSGLTNIASISTMDDYSCATRDNGRTLCWGNNSDGRLGDGTTNIRPMPAQVTTNPLPVTISIGGVACDQVNILSTQQISCTTGQQLPGAYDVVVSNGVTNYTLSKAYTYNSTTQPANPSEDTPTTNDAISPSDPGILPPNSGVFPRLLAPWSIVGYVFFAIAIVSLLIRPKVRRTETNMIK